MTSYENESKVLDTPSNDKIDFVNTRQASISEIIGYSAEEIERIYSGGLTQLKEGEGCGQNRNAHPIPTGIAVGGI